jgi:hypothetical protein
MPNIGTVSSAVHNLNFDIRRTGNFKEQLSLKRLRLISMFGKDKSDECVL